LNKDFSDYVDFMISPVIEGGYVNDPHDKGGETKYGISKASFPDEDIKNLTIDRAKYLYEKHYWVPAKCDKFLFPNNIILFDMAVNSGSARAIKTLQKACKVKEDGIVGPQTIGAANKLDFTLFLAERVLFYESLGQFNRYGRGWSRRLFNICIYICKKALERQ